ncbi:MAG: hypothetical protein N3F09_07465 [Bacteroidia bacterium]|nr:hypothetical protein [Bacteroidia bacterium]
MAIIIIHAIIALYLAYRIVVKNPLSFYFLLALLIKWIAIPVYFYFYQKCYGNFFHFDSGKYFTDALIFKKFFIENPKVFFHFMTGSLPSDEYSVVLKYLKDTFNWDDGFHARWLYNDNKLIILINFFLSFISGENYFVHALWFCFLSWIGMVWIFEYSELVKVSKSLLLLFIVIFYTSFPFLWFYTGSVLKEPVLVFFIGLQLLSFTFLEEPSAKKKCFGLFFIIPTLLLIRIPVMITYLIPYVLTKLSLLNHLIQKKFFRIILIVLSIPCFAIILNIPVVQDTLNAKRIPYLDIQNGGIFLKSKDIQGEIRFEYDTSIIQRMNKSRFVKIKSIRYYKLHKPSWDGTYHLHTDTSKVFELLDVVRPARTTIALPEIIDYCTSIKTSILSIMHFLFPIHAASLIEKIYLLENLFILLFILFMIAFGNHRQFWLVLCFLFFIIYTAYSSPNIGSLSRYRCIWMPEIILGGISLILMQWRNITNKLSA